MPDPRYLWSRRRLLLAGAAGVTAAGLPWSSPGSGTAVASEGAAGSATASSATVGGGSRAPRAKSVLLVLLSGGPSQLDMFDPKPEAPAAIRGEFAAIDTATPGIVVAEHLPLLAARLKHWAIVRSLSHGEHNHLLATHVALTGRPTPLARGGSDLDRVESRNDFPNLAAAVDYLRPSTSGVPTGVTLPNYFIEGPLTWPGQHAGFLGPRNDPWQINGDPNDPAFRMEALSLPAGVDAPRLSSRRELLDEVNRCPPRTTLAGGEAASALSEQQASAFSLLTSETVATAFDIHRENSASRDRYGRCKFGQSLLLARRLVDVGVPVVQAAMGIVQTWDTHVDNWGALKNRLLPQLDQGLAALIDDLAASGRLEETLVVVMGEFGRTPQVSTLPGASLPGRNHWAHAYSGLFAGAGVRGGQVVGQTDAIAAYPVTRHWSPADVCTTLFQALGLDSEATIADPLGRAHRLQNGEPIEPLYTGRAS